ncbi:MAG: sulfur oxidation c-type cytochrome SoxA [Minwuia sp.]|uniref:sulfur oxidation c-type cytochrome SoxA n=1 Tax=Minwuia sp. TaxID=2493630 RepID=UPI003A86CB04
MTIPRLLLLLVFGTIWFAAAAPAMADPPDPPLSGLNWATPAVREMQQDDFANPGMFWLEKGEKLFGKREGETGLACRTCHLPRALKGAAAAFPVVRDGQVVNLDGQVNGCRERHMRAEPYEIESEELLSLTLYLRSLSAGEPVAVDISGEAEPFFRRGEALYRQRRGQMNLACFQCHDDRPGQWLRGEQLSQGQINGFPAYLLRWSGVGSAHRRFRFCDDQRVAEPLPIGSDDYLALELYVAWRGNGLPVEAPAVRR